MKATRPYSYAADQPRTIGEFLTWTAYFCAWRFPPRSVQDVARLDENDLTFNQLGLYLNSQYEQCGEELSAALVLRTVNGLVRSFTVEGSITLNQAKESPLRELGEFARGLGRAKAAPPADLQFHFAADSADKNADRIAKKKNNVPSNKKVLQLAKRIRQKANSGLSQAEIAREFCEGDSRKAANLLRQLRRFPHRLT